MEGLQMLLLQHRAMMLLLRAMEMVEKTISRATMADLQTLLLQCHALALVCVVRRKHARLAARHHPACRCRHATGNALSLPSLHWECLEWSTHACGQHGACWPRNSHGQASLVLSPVVFAFQHFRPPILRGRPPLCLQHVCLRGHLRLRRLKPPSFRRALGGNTDTHRMPV